MADWQHGLAGVTDEQILQGLESLPKTWPPTVDEFRELCLGEVSGDGWRHNTAAYRMLPSRRLLEKKADKAKAKSELGRAKAVLSGQLSPRERQRQLADANRVLFGGEGDG